MRVIRYNVFWDMVDAIDIYIGSCFTRCKLQGLLGTDTYFMRLKHEWEISPVIAIKTIILVKFREDDALVNINPMEWVRINKGTSLESILAIIKSKYKGRNKLYERD